jgi:apolipoprotein D and lipocalin family protein
MRKILSLITLAISSAAVAQKAELTTVPYVDVDKYLGKWYEIASFPQRFQKGCNCTTAEYYLHPDGYIKVKNKCLKDGKLKVATAKAKIKDTVTNAKLSVQFFWPFSGKYWIIDLADDYSYAVVGHPNREYLWILARSPKMDDQTYQGILNRVQQKGFDLSKLSSTNQSCN